MNIDYMSSLLSASKYLPMAGGLSTVPRLLFSILKLAGLWKMFDKAGIPGWSALIPFYSLYCEVKMAKRSESFFWWMLSWMLLFPAVVAGAVFFLIKSGYFDGGSGAGGFAFVFFVLPVVFIVWVIPLFIMSVMLKHSISKAFGHGVGMTFGLILLPVIFYPILGFGSSQYQKEEGEVPEIDDAIFQDDEVLVEEPVVQQEQASAPQGETTVPQA